LTKAASVQRRDETTLDSIEKQIYPRGVIESVGFQLAQALSRVLDTWRWRGRREICGTSNSTTLVEEPSDTKTQRRSLLNTFFGLPISPYGYCPNNVNGCREQFTPKALERPAGKK
jgi:hypothetical protein